MCGRYSLTKEAEHVARVFELGLVPTLAPRFNIAPTQSVGAVIQDQRTGQRQWRHLRWGLIPPWAEDPSIGGRMINARCESLATKPAFRSALRQRRCLIPADGFYEWRKTGLDKQPYYITMADARIFAFAGLWEHWQGNAGEALESCTIVTTQSNDLMQSIHDRMPVILQSPDYARWLDPQLQDAQAVAPLLRPLHAAFMVAELVGPYVNSPRHEGARCIDRVPPSDLF